MQLVLTNKAAKLMKLCEIAGLTHTDKLLTLAATDNVVLGICTNRGLKSKAISVAGIAIGARTIRFSPFWYSRT